MGLVLQVGISQCKIGMERREDAGFGVGGWGVFQKMERDGGHVGPGGWVISAEDVFGKNCEILPPSRSEHNHV